MSEPVIKVEKLGKKYLIGTRAAGTSGQNGYKRLTETVMDTVTAPLQRLRNPGLSAPAAETIWALRDVSFDVKQGDVLGIIGHNGAGKTTLLRLLAQITEPSEGMARICGRVGSLLEVGTGFHPELTGRENIYLSGAILGMTRAEIKRRFDEIVAFASVEKFMDTPVKRFSSGMYVRLAFAVAVHLQTEILLVDEVLAVGDASFQLKCLNRMSDISGGGRTILFVSHNMGAMAKLCGRAILLEEGRIVRAGTPRECIDQYFSSIEERGGLDGGPVSLRNHPGRTKDHGGPVRLASLQVLDHEGKPTWNVACGESFTTILDYEFADGAHEQDVSFTVTISNAYNQRITTCRSQDTYGQPIRINRSGHVRCRINRLPIVPGIYRLTVSANTEAGPSDGVYDAADLEVRGSDFYPSGSVPPRAHGEVLFDHEWEVIR